jgi:putative endonuclease
MKHFFVYMLASERNGTLYIGMTSNLVQGVWQHRQKFVDGFTERYNVGRLVYFVELATAEAAITKEK